MRASEVVASRVKHWEPVNQQAAIVTARAAWPHIHDPAEPNMDNAPDAVAARIKAEADKRLKQLGPIEQPHSKPKPHRVGRGPRMAHRSNGNITRKRRIRATAELLVSLVGQGGKVIRVSSQLAKLIVLHGGVCWWCEKRCSADVANGDLYPSRDHLCRKADGGKSGMTNLVLACRKCNSTRHSPEVWNRARGKVPQ